MWRETESQEDGDNIFLAYGINPTTGVADTIESRDQEDTSVRKILHHIKHAKPKVRQAIGDKVYPFVIVVDRTEKTEEDDSPATPVPKKKKVKVKKEVVVPIKKEKDVPIKKEKDVPVKKGKGGPIKKGKAVPIKKGKAVPIKKEKDVPIEEESSSHDIDSKDTDPGEADSEDIDREDDNTDFPTVDLMPLGNVTPELTRKRSHQGIQIPIRTSTSPTVERSTRGLNIQTRDLSQATGEASTKEPPGVTIRGQRSSRNKRGRK